MENDATGLCLGNTGIIVTKDSQRNQNNDHDDESTPGGWSPLVLLAGATCCLGSALPAGYNIGVINNPADIMKEFCNETIQQRYNATVSVAVLDIIWATVISIFLVGGVTGSLSSSWLADKLGRRGALAVGNIFGIIGGILFTLVPALNSIEVLMLGRLLVGLSAGLATSLVPMYITEVAPLKLRGAVGVLCQLGITSGVLLGQILSLSWVLGTSGSWHIMLAAFAPLCLIALGITWILPESPKFLYIIKGRKETAIKELTRLRNMDSSLLENEIRHLNQEAVSAKRTDAWTIGRVLTDPTLRLPLILVVSMQASQQLSGVNAVFYYSNEIFKKAGLDKTQSEYATIATGVINAGMAVIAVPVVSNFGRRVLFLFSCYSSLSCMLILCVAIVFLEASRAMAYISIIAVLAYVLFFGLGLGPLPFFIGSELFDVGPRPVAMSLGSVANWGGNFLVGMTFPSMQRVIGPYSFLVFVGFLILVALLTKIYLPETRGKSTMEIAATITNGFKSRPNSTQRRS